MSRYQILGISKLLLWDSLLLNPGILGRVPREISSERWVINRNDKQTCSVFFFSQTFPTPAHGCCLSFPRWIIISRSISSKYLAKERPQVYRGMGGEVFRGAGESDWKRAVLSGPPARCNTCGQQRTARCRQAGCQLFFSFFFLSR